MMQGIPTIRIISNAMKISGNISRKFTQTREYFLAMNSKQLNLVVGALSVLACVWLVGFGILSWQGAFGDPNKPANPLWLLMWLAPPFAFFTWSENLHKKAKALTDAPKDTPSADALLSFGARFRSKVLPIGIGSILGLCFSVFLAFMVVSQSDQVLTPNASLLAQSSAVVSGLFSGIHVLSTLYLVILTAVFGIGSLIGLTVFLYRTAVLTWTALRAK